MGNPTNKQLAEYCKVEAANIDAYITSGDPSISGLERLQARASHYRIIEKRLLEKEEKNG